MKHLVMPIRICLMMIVPLLFWQSLSSHGGQYGGTREGEEAINTREMTRHAAEAVDGAWEAFHQAAIGGTLASPEIQFHIEQQLHKARTLLLDSKKAERRQDYASVKFIIQQLDHLTQEIVTASQERKQ